MNKNKEYFTLKEIAEMNNMSVQNVRKRLNEIEQTELMVMKDFKGAYIGINATLYWRAFWIVNTLISSYAE